MELSACSERGVGVTRMSFTPEHQAALDMLRTAMSRAGLLTSLDNAGTLVGRHEGPAGSGTFLMGSHQDSVRQGGAYDGIMGVVLPILALEKLRSERVDLPFTVEVLAFADEEGVRFPTALIGSRALAGSFDPSVLEMEDDRGITLRDAMTSFGLDPDRIGEIRRDPNNVIGFLEAHIEQGPILEREHEAVGVVTAICGIERHRINVIGETGHAGTLPMEGRRDALVGAATIVSQVNIMGRESTDLRATVGALTVEPNVVNAVPRVTRLTAEFRSPRDEIRRGAGEALHRFVHELSEQSGLTIDCKLTYEQAAQACASDLSVRLIEAARSDGGQGPTLPSGATHDASAMAELCPVAMLFVRCRDGVSHRPEEFASPEDMARAISVISDFLKSVR